MALGAHRGHPASLGDLLLATDRSRAFRLYESSVQDRPISSNLVRLAGARMVQGRYAEARDLYQRATKLNSWIGDLWLGLAQAQFKLGDIEGARASLATARRGLLLDRPGADALGKQLNQTTR